MRRSFALFLTLLTLVPLTGCWDRREINDIVFISATAVDKADELYKVTVQFPLPSQLGGAGSTGGGGGTRGAQAWHTETATGRTGREANAKQQASLSRHVNFSHRRVLLIGEGLAKSGIAELMDILGRIPQNRMTAYLLVTEVEAEKLFEVDSSLEQSPAEMLREIAGLSYKRPVTIEATVNALLMEGTDPYIPLVGTTPGGKTDRAEREAALKGIALFRDERLATTLKGDAARGLMFALNQASQPVVTVPAPEGKGYISVRVTKSNVHIDAKPRGTSPRFTLRLQGEMIASENNSTYRFAQDGEPVANLEDAVNEHLEATIREAIDVTKEHRVDPIGLGLHLYRYHPSEWRKIKQHWRDIYAKVDIQIQSELRFEHPGTIKHPLGIPKEEVRQ
ncbi:MAG TPA: Ger(x)C family spore germination protein [Paenibacillus sp.]|nr:Ger(x)C family spore germination protein [Paenibacillus sp.]